MAKKKYIPKKSDDGLKPIERIAKMFAEQLIVKLEETKLDWQKPWFTNMNSGAAQNFDGRRYKGMNQLILALKQEEMGYQLPFWITFQHAKKLGANINKGEKSINVWLGSRIFFDSEGKKIPASVYHAMSPEEQRLCSFRPFAKSYAVFNIQQTNYPELYPEHYSALKEKLMVRTVVDDTGMLHVPKLDTMIENQTWLCPIKPVEQDQAYYSISKDSITVPLKGQFIDGESFYKTLLHEMAHSTGAENRLNRLMNGGFGSQEYAREELVAEMTAAVAANSLGFSSGLKEDSVAYIQSWLDELKESPDFMLTVMKDVNKACTMVEDHINKVNKIQVDDSMDLDIVDVEAEEIDDNQEVTTETEKEMDEPEHKMAVPESKPEYRVENESVVPIYGQQRKEPLLHKAYMGNGITIWEDGDAEYTAHISPDRKVSMYKEFSAANKQAIERLAEAGNMTYRIDDKTSKLILEPTKMATHLLPNSVTGEMYPVSKELLNPDKPETAVYCTGQQVLADDVADRLVTIRYPREYVFSITGLQNIRPIFYKLAKNGMDTSEMADMLEITDDIIEGKKLEKNEIENKVLYFRVKDNKIEKFNRLLDEVGPELPRYWFHDNMLRYNHPGKAERKNQTDAQILAGGEAIIRVRGTENYNSAVNSLAEKGIAMLPKLEAEMRLFAQVVENLTDKQRKDAVMYLFVKDGVVVDTEPNINEKEYDLPKFIYDGIEFKRWTGQKQVETKDITNHLNNMSMENNQENKQEAKKEMKDGLYLFPMKSGDYGINEVKNGVATPTIRIQKDAPELKAFFEAVKGNSKEVRNEEIKKLADKYLTPENIAAAEERKAKRAEETANGEKKESGYIRIPEVKPEIRERIANVRTFKMQDGKTMAVSADIDGAHMTKPMGEKLQNTFFSKAKGTTGDEKKELDIAVAAMTFRKELSEPKQEQSQSAGMKR